MTGAINGLRHDVVAGTALLRRPGDNASTPLVLLHGIGSNAASWAPMLARLDPRIDATAWDAPGYGGSSPLAEASPRPQHYAARLEAVLDGLGLGRVMLAGHSLGALFAANFAASRPARVAALALLSPASGYRVPPGGTLPDALQARIDDLDRLGAEAFATARSPRLVHRPEASQAVLARVQRAMAAVHPAGYAQAVRALGAGDLLADAARIAPPVLVAVGTHDRVTPPAGVRAVFAALTHGLRLVELPDAGHALPQECPAEVARLLCELAAVSRRAA